MCLVHVAETVGETKGGKSQRLALAEGGRLAVHSLSARNSRDRQTATATAAAAAILRPTHLTHIQSVGIWTIDLRNLETLLLSSPRASLLGSLDVLGFPHSVRHGLSQTGPSLCSAHITHSVRVASACDFRTCMRYLGDGLRRAIAAV